MGVPRRHRQMGPGLPSLRVIKVADDCEFWLAARNPIDAKLVMKFDAMVVMLLSRQPETKDSTSL